ncbi:MAG TPA: alkaline phosphatase PhoX [Acidimicrobiales bacterium]|nr:alkaline phosphatase PhoX [Acidimicrobiales bacterium]
MTLTRRELLRNSALSGVALAAGGTFSGLALGGVAGATGPGRGPGPGPGRTYGRLVPDPDGILDLPEGFRYEILAEGGTGHPDHFTTYDDGQKLAGDADGMASFAIGGNRTVLVTNHELTPSERAEMVPHTFAGQPVPTYDPAATGGTSNIVLDRDNRVVSVYPSIAGTHNNCAGGPTPWGTWLTCEENESDIGVVPHGYVFEVDPEGKKTVATPYKAMGRYKHEAAAVDPETSAVYLTEDHNDGLFYKFVPDDTSMQYGSLGNGGTLYAMKAGDLGRLGEIKTVGRSVKVRWTEISNPDQQGLNGKDELADDAAVTRSRKLEGCWYGNRRIYFNCADENASPEVAHHGQVWSLDPKTDVLTLVAYIPTTDPVFDRPDNVTVTPWGQLILCEDGDDDQYLILCDPRTGELSPFAHNAMGSSEFAGANFSPDGQTLFVNIMGPSTTFAITGPWTSARPRRR